MRRSLVLTALLVAACSACKNGQKAGAAKTEAETSGAFSAAREADLYFTTGTLGYVEPCGCTSEPLGGIQRLASVVTGDCPSALVDAGHLLFPKEPLDAVSGPQHRLKAKLLARAYRKLGAVAINFGAGELADGRAFLSALQREGAVPFVSTNVRPVGDGGPAIAQSFLRTIGGIKFGFTGVAAPEAFEGIDSVTAIEYAPALRGEVKTLKKRGADVIVVLAELPDRACRDLAEAVPGLDVIIRGVGTPITRTPSGPTKAKDTWIFEAGSQGQHVGRLRVALAATAPVASLALDDGGYAERKRRDLNARKIVSLRRQIDGWQGDASKKEAITAREAQIARLEAANAAPIEKPTMTGPHMAFEMIPLTVNVPAAPEMKAVLDTYYAQLAGTNLTKGDPAKCKPKSKEDATFVGTQACEECHEEAVAFWKTTKHAAAWKTLEDDNKHYDLTCIGCHTVGYEKPGGFCRLADVGVLKDVGCENCHGPGSLHIEQDGDTDLITLETPESTCAGECHVPEHSDTFDYAKYIVQITGEGHELASEIPGVSSEAKKP